MRWLRWLGRHPIAWLLAVAFAAALFIFRDFGLAWDEPLFYRYADALGYAYAPANWFSGEFDLNRSYGPSADDHKTRGPGYLFIARLPARALQQLGVDAASSWHLVNFGTFLLGVYFVYRLGQWLAGETTALSGAALFASQPLLWGHAFINPKDMPFLVLLSGAIWLGVQMVDRLSESQETRWYRLAAGALLPAVFLGLASSNRVLGPLGGLLVSLYWIARRPGWRTIAAIVLYGMLACAVMIATWPYLWESPLRFVEVFGLMAQNPTVLPVLFAESVYRANELPVRYLPFYFGTTITEPVWPLFGLGLVGSLIRARASNGRGLRLMILLSWLLVPLAYALVARPPFYDGMRHFLFVLPPVFVIGAQGLEFLLRRLSRGWTRIALASLVLVPGLAGIVLLHPYEYAYFNSLTGGTGGAFRRYETEYWLTCYKESLERFNEMVSEPTRLFVHREAAVALPYAAPHVTVLDERGAKATILAGDYILVNTRTNEDQRTYPDAPELLRVGRAGATFCVIKSVP
ncbi:MAG: hypothetical protein V1755_13450 [Chloroflexota bacterium]